MCWHRQKETSVGSAGGFEIRQVPGRVITRLPIWPHLRNVQPTGRHISGHQEGALPTGIQINIPKKTGIWQLNNQRIGPQPCLEPTWYNFRDIWVHDSTCHSWHTSNWFTQVSWCLDISWSCNSPRLENSETSWKWTARFLAPFAPDRILGLRQGWTKLWVGIASPYSVRTWHQFHIQVCKNMTLWK